MQVAISRNTNDRLDLVAGVVIKTVFKELWLWNDAQAAEWIDIIIGINFEYYKRPQSGGGGGAAGGEAQPVVPLTHAAANTNVVPAAQACRRALVKADVNNTQTAWVDFDAAAVQGACLPLDPGESVTVSIDNLSRINANFEVGGEYCFIVYEL